ncbi:MAG: hypothetical protein NTU76_01830 [Candidatus Taylorbacteria bacterium]|nr:hypothetical protein [Candidatus Taylorbacteria bacterium]
MTNLEWSCLPSKMTWYDASDWCIHDNHGWRLPTVEELLFAYRKSIQGFEFDVWYWTGNSDRGASRYATSVVFRQDHCSSTSLNKETVLLALTVRDRK